MQVTETLNEGQKRGYAITLTAAELDAKVTEKLKDAQPDVEMKGFRKGKVPMALMKKKFGQSVLGEAMQEAIDGAMGEHFEKSGDRPAMQPKVEMIDGENWKEGDDVAVDVGVRVLNRVPHARLCGKVNNLVEFLLGEQRFHCLAIGKINTSHFERVNVFQDRRS